jgi:predicted transcriptional regulator
LKFTEKIDQPAPTIDHQTKTFDATEELILLDQDYAFVKKDDQIIGIVCLDELLKEYQSGDEPEATIEKFINPYFRFSAYEKKSKEVNLIQENFTEPIAVTNKAGDILGLVSNKKLKIEF